MSDLTTSGQTGIAPMQLVHQLMQRPDFTTEMLRDLLDMMKEQEHRQALRVFKAAFARCQAKVTKAEQDKPNPVFRSRYASLEAMYNAVWPAVMAEGFSWTVSALGKAPDGWDNTVIWFQGRLSMDIVTETVELPVSRNALSPESPRGGRAVMSPTQALGALTTYMRKYLLGLMFSVVTAEDVKLDNDGNRDLPPDDRDPPPPPPSSNGTQAPADPWDVWLDRLEAEAAKVTDRAAWNVLWTRPTIVDSSKKLQGEHLARYQEIQLRHAKRVFPTEQEATDGAPSS